MLRSVVFACCLAVGSSLPAAQLKLDSLTAGFITYSNVTVMGANATDLFISHDKGMSNVKLKHVSEALQKQFNYNREKAEQIEREQAETDARYMESVATNLVEDAARALAARTAQLEARLSETKLSDPISEDSLLGNPAPELALEKWVNDEKPELEDKAMLVSFFASWSAPCRKQFAALNGFHKTCGEQLAVMGVTKESEEAILDMEGEKIEFPCAIDSQGKLSAAARVTSVPTVMLIDRQNIVRFVGHPAALTEAALKNILQPPDAEE